MAKKKSAKATEPSATPVETPDAAPTPAPDQSGYVPKINDAIRIPIQKIKPAPVNVNALSEDAFGMLVSEIRANGFDEPLQVLKKGEEYIIIGGHHRWKACSILGYTEIPCVVYDYDDKKAMEQLVRRNMIRGKLDHEKFGDMLASYLKGESDFDWKKMADTFAVREQDIYKAARTNEDLAEYIETTKTPDALPAVPTDEEPFHVSEVGDLFTLGTHKLIVGDSTKEEVLAKLMGEERANLFVTDPPYGVNYTGKARPKSKSQGKKKEYAGGKDWGEVYDESEQSIGNYWDFLKASFSACAKFLLPRTAWYVWHAHQNAGAVMDAFTFAGIKTHQQIIWEKPSSLLSFSFFPWQHEPCLEGWGEHDETPPANAEEVLHYMELHEQSIFGWPTGEKPPHKIDKSRFLTTIWRCDFDGKAHIRKSITPFQKPVSLFEIPMLHHTEPGMICLEPFSGSGSQIIAGQRTGRRVYACELNPFFADLSILRFMRYCPEAAITCSREGVVEKLKKFLEQSVKIEAEKSGKDPVTVEAESEDQSQ